MGTKEDTRSPIGAVVLSVGVVAAISVGAWIVGRESGASGDGMGPVNGSTSRAPSQAIEIDSSIGEVFTPASKQEASEVEDTALSSDDAYERYHPGEVPPRDATIVLGYLDMPVGAGDPGKYVANHQLVYAFQWQQCGPLLGQPIPNPTAKVESAAPSVAPRCNQWTFLDASTGQLIDLTWR